MAGGQFGHDFLDGTFGIFRTTNFGGGTLPIITPQTTIAGRTGRFVKFEVKAGEARSELEVPQVNGSTDFRRGERVCSVENYCLAPGFPYTATGTHQVLRQWKDIGPQSTTPPIQLEAVSGVIRLRGPYRGFRNGGGSGADWRATLIASPQTNVWYTFAFELYLNGPSSAQGSFPEAGWARALQLINGVWVEIVPKTFPFNGTFYTDGGQTWSRTQGGIYHQTTMPPGVAYRGPWQVGTSLTQLGVSVGGSTGGGTTPPPPPTTRPLSGFSELFATTGAEFPVVNRVGSVAVSASQMRLTIDAAIPWSYARTVQDIDITDSAAIVQAISWPSWVSGSGEVASYMTLDFGNDSRLVLRRRVTYAGSATPTVDQLESRRVIGGTDTAPVLTNWSAVPSGTTYLKIGSLADGTISYQTSADGSSFAAVATRSSTGMDLTVPAWIEVGLQRLSGNVVTTTLSLDNVVGSGTPGPGTTGTKGDTSLHFDGTHIRVFPSSPATSQALLVISKAANASRSMVPAALSKAAGVVVLDNANRADGAIGANWTGANGTMPVIVSNQFSSGVSVGNARAIWNTSLGSPDMSVWTTISNIPGNPAATVVDWRLLMARISGSATTTTGYMCCLYLLADGRVGPVFKPIINGVGGTAMNGSAVYGYKTPALNDKWGMSVVGSTLEVWHQPASTGVWALWGSTTDTTYTAGNFAGAGAVSSGTDPVKWDDFGAVARGSTAEAFPANRGGRYMRITTGRQPQFWDGTLAPPNGFGAGTLPATPAWSAELVTRNVSTGQVSTRIWDATTGVFQENPNVGSIGVGSSISDSGARFVIGDRQPNAVTDESFVGDVALVAGFSADPGSAAFEGAVQSGGVVSVSALKAIAGIVRLYDLTKMAAGTDTINDQVGTAHEVTGERVGTGTIATDTGNVPVVTGTAVTPPAPTPSVPDPTGFQVVSATIDPAAPTTGKLVLSVDAPVADASISFTPHASPISFWYSTDNGASWTQLNGSWQGSTTATVTGLPLDTGDETTARLWSARYRSNAGTPLLSDFATPIRVVISQSLSPIDPPSGVVPIQNNGGTLDVYWDPNPPEDFIDRYDVKYAEALTDNPADTVFGTAPFYEGPGTLVVGGTYNGKLTCPQITGLDDLKAYDVSVDARRGSA